MGTDVIVNLVASIKSIRDNFPEEEHDQDVQDILYDLCYTVLVLIKEYNFEVTPFTAEMVDYCRQEVIRQNGGAKHAPTNIIELAG